MRGVDNQFDEIWLSLHPGNKAIRRMKKMIILVKSIYFIAEQLTNALSTLKTNFIRAIIIKLTKKQFPCLSIDIEHVNYFVTFDNNILKFLH